MDKEYYSANGIKTIDVIDSFGLNFALGCVIKYVLRAGRKTNNKLEDLKKAKDYLEFEIDKLSKQTIKDDWSGLQRRENQN